MITAQEIESYPSGRVLKRWQTPQGRHEKMRIVKPITYQSCDECHEGITGKAVKTETGGNITLHTQCPVCAAMELNDDSNS